MSETPGMPKLTPPSPGIPKLSGGGSPKPKAESSIEIPDFDDEPLFVEPKTTEIKPEPIKEPNNTLNEEEAPSFDEIFDNPFGDEDDVFEPYVKNRPEQSIEEKSVEAETPNSGKTPIGKCDSCGKNIYSLSGVIISPQGEVTCSECSQNVSTDIPQKPVNKESGKKKGKKEENKDKYGREVYVDEEKKRLLPFGGKRKVKVDTFDQRKNLRKRGLIVQWIAIGLGVLILLVGFRNAIFPQKGLTANDVLSIVQENTNIDTTGFPLEDGAAFAQNFIKAFVSSDATSQRVLKYYYTGSWGADLPAGTGIEYKSGYNSTVVYGPVVWEQKALREYSAAYTVGVLVSPNVVDDSGKVVATPTDDSKKEKWMTFNVNVYYDPTTKSFSIGPDSPTVIPNPTIKSYDTVPDPYSLGTRIQDTERITQLSSVVYGFMQGYVQSTETNHAAIDQYLIANPPAELLNGLGGQYEFAGSVQDAVQFEAYDVDGDPGTVKVKINVTWRSPIDIGSDNTDNKVYAEIKSSYLMTLIKQDNGKYLVSNFAAKYYAK